MDRVSLLQTYVVGERFEKALKTIRGALCALELDIVGEFDLSEHLTAGSERRLSPLRILLVSCPILDFEAVALKRAAAVFFPLHVLVFADKDQTRVSVVNPAELLDGSLLPGAAGPLSRLVGRVTLALDALEHKAGAVFN